MEKAWPLRTISRFWSISLVRWAKLFSWLLTSTLAIKPNGTKKKRVKVHLICQKHPWCVCLTKHWELVVVTGSQRMTKCVVLIVKNQVRWEDEWTLQSKFLTCLFGRRDPGPESAQTLLQLWWIISQPSVKSCIKTSAHFSTQSLISREVFLISTTDRNNDT